MTAWFTAAEQARLNTINNTPWAEEALRERIARAMWDADHDFQHGHRRAWEQAVEDEADAYRRLADAALAVIHKE